MRACIVALSVACPRTSSIRAQETPAAAASVQTTQPKQYDWVLTNTQEWVRGQVTSLDDRVLVFESDTFGTLHIDWSSVTALYVSHRLTYALDGAKRIVVGQASYENGTITLNGRPYADRSLLRIMKGGDHEEQYWHFNLSSGFALHAGNGKQFTWTNLADLTRDDGITNAILKYNGSLGGAAHFITTNNHTGRGQLDVSLNAWLHVIPFLGALTYDKEQNIALRAAVAAGAGVTVVDTGAVSWKIDSGPGYLTNRPITVESGSLSAKQDFGIFFSTHLKIDFTDSIKLKVDWLSLLAVTHIERSYHSATAALRIEITDQVGMDVATIFERVESPVSTEAGRTPQSNDLQLVVGLGVKL